MSKLDAHLQLGISDQFVDSCYAEMCPICSKVEVTLLQLLDFCQTDEVKPGLPVEPTCTNTEGRSRAAPKQFIGMNQKDTKLGTKYFL